ncbi:MAG: thioesterase [Clostridiaceae bacterium]|nr:thioesterase [Clostridiaceae bacterium]
MILFCLPFAGGSETIYGHSMGSLLAYELYYKVSELNLRKPRHIFFSGYRAPSIIREKKNIHTLPNYDFMKKVMELGGTPDVIMNNQELLQVFLPILRSDFKILETYNYKEREDFS